MTQRIFKKSNKQDMIDLFNILPDEVKFIQLTKYSDDYIELKLCTNILISNCVSITNLFTDTNFYNIFKIDFETDDKIAIIERPKEVK